MTFMKHSCGILATLCALGSQAASPGASAAWRLAGAEFNPVRAMPDATARPHEGARGVRWHLLSGTLRIADDPRRDEITIPVSWSTRRAETSERSVDRTVFQLDVQYRRFLSRSNHGGPYAGPLLRVSHRRGHDRWAHASAREDRVGAGLVVGYRLPMADFHWDLSFTRGRFLGPRRGAAHDPTDAAVETGALFADIGVLRLGRRF